MYRAPWVTLVLILLSVAVYFAASVDSVARDEAVRITRHDLAAELEAAAPGDLISPATARALPLLVRARWVRGRVAETPTDPAISWSLDAKASAFGRALLARPSFRLGHRAGEPTLSSFLTSPLLHGDVPHLASNMLYLAVLGAAFEFMWRRAVYLALYLLSAAAACLAYSALGPATGVSAVGASGAISAMMGFIMVGYPPVALELLRSPRRRPDERPILEAFLAGLWTVTPLLFIADAADLWLGSRDGIAHSAHVGGWVFGAVAALVVGRSGRLRPGLPPRQTGAFGPNPYDAVACSGVAASPDGSMPSSR